MFPALLQVKDVAGYRLAWYTLGALLDFPRAALDSTRRDAALVASLPLLGNLNNSTQQLVNAAEQAIAKKQEAKVTALLSPCKQPCTAPPLI